ncbi:MAG: response regulator [Microbacteriaceae bacterium]|nr:MAG: response regulator [Microbacteriaceae bacterium]
MRTALVVDDEYESRQLAALALQQAGFNNIRFAQNRSEAIAYSQDAMDEFDLVVVDRNLPDGPGDTPAQTTGDLLLVELLERVRDRPFVVFTGWDDSPLYQTVLGLTSRISVGGPEDSIQQVTVLRKDQSVELAAWARSICQILDRVDAIEIDTDQPLSHFRSRLLRKAALHYDGTHIKVRELSGGRSGESVWRCDVRDSAGRRTGTFIAKERAPGAPLTRTTLAGIGAIAPSRLVAGHIARIEGVSGRRVIDIYQAAGIDSQALFEIAGSDPGRASECVRDMASALEDAHTTTASSIPISEAMEVFLPWAEAEERLRELGLGLQAGIMVSVAREHQHGDLHGENVLVDGAGIAIIDFDRQCVASRVVDPITLLLSWFLHPGGPAFADINISGQDLVMLLDGTPAGDPCVEEIRLWVKREKQGDRDLWAAVMGYSLRQLRYHEVGQSQVARERLTTLISEAVVRLAR